MRFKKIVPILLLPVLGYIGYYNVFNTGNKPTMPLKADGINHNNINWEANPKEDFYEFANGNWMKNTDIPADKSVYGTLHKLQEQNEAQLKELITRLTTNDFNSLDTEAQKIVKLYNSFMDEPTAEELGMSPINPLMTQINNISTKVELKKTFADFQLKQISGPFYLHIMQDMKKADQYIPGLFQSGL